MGDGLDPGLCKKWMLEFAGFECWALAWALAWAYLRPSPAMFLGAGGEGQRRVYPANPGDPGVLNRDDGSPQGVADMGNFLF